MLPPAFCRFPTKRSRGRSRPFLNVCTKFWYKFTNVPRLFRLYEVFINKLTEEARNIATNTNSVAK